MGKWLYRDCKYKSIVDGKKTKESICWNAMRQRCLNKKFQERKPTYLGCTMSENFMDFQYFAEWCQHQMGWNEPHWQLDKDFLVPDNKIYHEDICVFLPNKLNSFSLRNDEVLNGCRVGVHFSTRGRKFIANVRDELGKRVYVGAYNTEEEAFEMYKKAKQEIARRLASTYQGRVDQRVIDVLNNFKIN